MKEYFGDDVLLHSETAKELYLTIRDLPILDYHSHLNEKEIRDNLAFTDVGEMWLSSDHYKWRAMRLCGVDEKYITGDADYHTKFLKYAEILPLLAGNALYYWTQFELKELFDIREPLCVENAERIYQACNRKLPELRVRDILRKFHVEYIATTDDPASTLSAHGQYESTLVCPSFRPDRMLALSPEALSDLEAASGQVIRTLDDFKAALSSRLDYFYAKGCRITDHGMDFLPVADCGAKKAQALFDTRDTLTAEDRLQFSSHMLYWLAGLYAKKGMTMQMHFATYRCVNTEMFKQTGRDSGFDIMRGECDTDRLVAFFNTLTMRDALPKVVLYSLNPAILPSLATLSGAFAQIRIGAAWWFNDTLRGIQNELSILSEYAVLGTGLGMLTDSRYFGSYIRFDFFRRILADFVAGYVENGEYDLAQAKDLVYRVCYQNPKEFFDL